MSGIPVGPNWKILKASVGGAACRYRTGSTLLATAGVESGLAPSARIDTLVFRRSVGSSCRCSCPPLRVVSVRVRVDDVSVQVRMLLPASKDAGDVLHVRRIRNEAPTATGTAAAASSSSRG